jgi:hypothetical protein
MRLETRRRTAHVALAAVVATASSLLLADGSAVARTSLASGKSLVGTWTRKNSCSAFVKALTQAGLRTSMKEWLVGAGYFKSPADLDSDAVPRCDKLEAFAFLHEVRRVWFLRPDWTTGRRR